MYKTILFNQEVERDVCNIVCMDYYWLVGGWSDCYLKNVIGVWNNSECGTGTHYRPVRWDFMLIIYYKFHYTAFLLGARLNLSWVYCCRSQLSHARLPDIFTYLFIWLVQEYLKLFIVYFNIPEQSVFFLFCNQLYKSKALNMIKKINS